MKLDFSCDYLEGAHERIINRLAETNLQKLGTYGFDEISESGKNNIRMACDCKDAAVYFLVGGTQTNATVIDAFLRPYHGAIAASTGHIGIHEAGAIEAGGHKVLQIPMHEGKISAAQIRKYLEDFLADETCDHMVQPGLVYISQPTEYGTLYSLDELKAIHDVCCAFDLPLYVDGARLAYALGSPQNDVQLPDLARLCDAFYIGGTKCGALLGEAVVLPDPERFPHFFTLIKQHGALVAKGRILGIQFDELFRDDLYMSLGKEAVRLASQIQDFWVSKGNAVLFASPTNQIFPILENTELEKLGENVNYSVWEKVDDTHTVIRLATSWATTENDVQALIRELEVL